MNLLTIQILKSGEPARSFLAYPNEEAALSALYYAMQASIADENVASIVALLIDDNGITHKFESWIRSNNSEVIEPEN